MVTIGAAPRRPRWLLATAATTGALAVAAAPADATPATAAGASLVIDTFAGTGEPANTGDGGPARKAGIAALVDVAAAPDGTVYVAGELQIRAIEPKTANISTVAGTGDEGFAGDGGPAAEAMFSLAPAIPFAGHGMAVGPAGTLYVADAGNNRIRAIDPDSGTIRTVAGSGRTGDYDGAAAARTGDVGDGGPATEAKLYLPSDVAADGEGNLYIADTYNNRIRKVSASTGEIDTIAGNGYGDRDDGTATGTSVQPGSVTVTPEGTVYFTELGESGVSTVDTGDNDLTSVPGTEDLGVGQENLSGLAASPDGKTLYLAEQRRGTDQVYALDLANHRLEPFAGGDEGALGDGRRPTAATFSGYRHTLGLAVADGGDVYVADQRSHRVRVVAQRSAAPKTAHRVAGEDIRTLVGSGRELDQRARRELTERESGRFYRDVHPLAEVDLDRPDSVAVADDGTLYIADTGNDRIRMVSPGNDEVVTVAGRPATAGADKPSSDEATDAGLSDPRRLALDEDDSKLYFVDGGERDLAGTAVRVVDLGSGTIDTVSGATAPRRPADIATSPDGTVFVVDAGSSPRVCALRGTSGCETVAEASTDSRDFRSLYRPTQVTAAPDGMLYVADEGRIKSVRPKTGSVTTVAGFRLDAAAPRQRISGDGGPALSAGLGHLGGITAGPDGWLYFTERANHRIRAVHPKTGVIKAVAGGGGSEVPEYDHQSGRYAGGDYAGDGGPARRARFDSPADVAVGPDAELYVADTGNNRVRVVGEPAVEPAAAVHPLVRVVGGLVLLAALAAGAVGYRRRRQDRRSHRDGDVEPRTAGDDPAGGGNSEQGCAGETR